MARCWFAGTEISAGDNAMISFLEWYEEHKKQLEEDAVMSAGDVSNGSAAEVVSPNAPAANVKPLDVSAPSSHSVGLSDKSVLGPSYCSKKCKDNGFFGKGDFRIPQNVLSGDIDRRIDYKS